MGCNTNLRDSDFKRKLMGFSCLKLFIFIATFEIVVVSSELYDSLIQNPGKGVNFYGKAQSDGTGNTYDDSDSYVDNYVPGINCEINNPIQCDYSYPYQTYNGSCNNLYIPRLGERGQCFLRFIPPYYKGYGDFRESVKGGPLPPPRTISVEIFKEHHKPNVNVSFQFPVFGQFIAADIVRSQHFPPDCCAKENANKPDCKPIAISPDDPFYSKYGKTCLDFGRTLQCSCDTTYRSQINGVTSEIDFSQIYGNSEEAAMEIRTLDGTGKIKMNETSVGSLLPNLQENDSPFCSNNNPQGAKCFKGADEVVNLHSYMTSFITVFTREHNRIATRLKQMNPQWGEEKLYQEARKINIGQVQSIFFQEFFPILVSPQMVEEFHMTVKKGTDGMQYDPSVIMGVWNEFAIGSYRLHTLVVREVGALGLRFKDTFSNPALIRQGHLSDLLKGAEKTPCEQYDRYVVTDLTDYLLQMPGMEYGKDLISINIQRGRDHGLPPYVEAIKFCSDGKIHISSFDDLDDFGIMEKENVDVLKRIYAAVEDVDLWAGLQLENLYPGAVTGPTAVCFNVKQFWFNQKGDRFYFDIEGKHAPFTPAQRSTLKQSSLARVLCDNTDIGETTKNPFLLENDENPSVSCNEIPEVDLTQWKDTGDEDC